MTQNSPDEFVKGISNGNRRMIAKAITLIESRLKDHQTLAFKVMEQILPHTGNSIRLGITGVPGVGKSLSFRTIGITRYGRRILEFES